MCPSLAGKKQLIVGRVDMSAAWTHNNPALAPTTNSHGKKRSYNQGGAEGGEGGLAGKGAVGQQQPIQWEVLVPQGMGSKRNKLLSFGSSSESSSDSDSDSEKAGGTQSMPGPGDGVEDMPVYAQGLGSAGSGAGRGVLSSSEDSSENSSKGDTCATPPRAKAVSSKEDDVAGAWG